jgi:CubicO group peptidase (beta-lactamase class C family)
MSRELPPRCDPARWSRVEEFAARLVTNSGIACLSCAVFGRDWSTPVIALGEYTPFDNGIKKRLPVTSGTIYLTASLTKPVLALGVLRLVEKGEIALSDRVSEFIPEYDGADRKRTTLLQLLTHTSGLPDMLPNNTALRDRNAPLASFVKGACSVTLDFPPGHGVQYQSMGYALLGETIQRISGMTARQFLAQELFTPLGMRDTSLGVPESWESGEFSKSARIAPVDLPFDQEGKATSHWNWNSPYWHAFGAPWGGMFSTIGDLTRLCRMMLELGRLDGVDVFSPQTIRSAVSNQLTAQREVPEGERRARPWGLGWRWNWKDHSACFCDLAAPEAYGHFGATGTMMFVDPAVEAGAVILSTRPMERGSNWMTRLANLLFASIR